MSGTWLPSLMPPFWRKRKSSSTIDFSLVLRLVNYINNSQQQHQQKKIRWSRPSVSSSPFLSWQSASEAVIFLLFFFFPFTAFLQFCSRQESGSMAVLLHSLTAYHAKMESLPKGWQWVRHGLYANDIMKEGRGRHSTQAELVPSLNASLSYRSSSLLRAVGGLHIITSLCIQQTAKSQKKKKCIWFFELRVNASGGKGKGVVAVEVGGGVRAYTFISVNLQHSSGNSTAAELTFPFLLKNLLWYVLVF